MVTPILIGIENKLTSAKKKKKRGKNTLEAMRNNQPGVRRKSLLRSTCNWSAEAPCLCRLAPSACLNEAS